MPIYEYRCTACGRTTELLQKIDDPPPTECSHCQGAVEKLFSAPSFQFKGSGWYVTDYGKSAGASSKSESAPSGEGSGKETDSSAKPAAEAKSSPSSADSASS